MKTSVRYTITAAVLAACVLVLILISGAERRARHLMTCNGVRVEYTDDFRFITEQDIKNCLDTKYGAYIGQRLDSIRLDRIEEILSTQSAILSSEAYTADDSLLYIKVTQRKPVVRFQHGSDGFYADAEGYVFPLQDHYTSQVPVIDGEVPGISAEGPSEYSRKWLKDVTEMLEYMSASRVWAENIVQIHVDEKGELTLVPREGREKFTFGQPDGAQDKFARMEKYYRYIKPSREEGWYGSVNVKYEKQIICKK